MEYTKDMSKITEKQIRREAARYKSRAAFILGSPEEFSSALESGTLDEYCAHMVGGRRALKWTPETIASEASEYSTRTEFAKGSGSAYEASVRLGIRDTVCKHMVSGRRRRFTKWTPNEIAAEASNYSTRTDFQKGSGSAYRASGRMGIRDDVCAHMVRATK